MMTLAIVIVAVISCDQMTKLLLRSASYRDAFHANLRYVSRSLWLNRLGFPNSRALVSGLWISAALPLVLYSHLMKTNPICAGLLVGGSLSHGVEAFLRGSVTDFVVPRFGLAFTLADIALLGGALAMFGEFLFAIVRH